ncbi:MAG: hypothetical protein PVI43_06885, partial [Candidatus Bathyarchaeota archaeon]
SKPRDAEGVTVKLTSIDPNNNWQDIGEVTTDMWGNFGISWVPPVPGEYLIMATFEGSASYGSSSASTYFVVDEAPSAAQAMEPEPAAPEPVAAGSDITPPTETAIPTETSSITTETAILAAVTIACIIGVINLWALRKRK